MKSKLKKLLIEVEDLFEKKRHREIIELLNDIVLEEYNDAILYAWRARAHYRLDEWESSLQYAQNAIDKDDKCSMGYMARAVYWSIKGEDDQAISDYTLSIDLSPKYPDTYSNRGITWEKKGEYDKAVADYTEAIKLRPDYSNAYYNRGSALHKKGEYDRAIADYTKTIESNPDDKSYNNRGISWHDKEEYDNAISDYTKAIEFNPNNPNPYYNRALSWYGKGESEKAIRDFKEYLKFTHDKKDVWSQRAEAEIEQLTRLLGDKKLGQIADTINNIKSLLLFKEGCITHYTGLSTARSLLLEDSILRISEGAFLNDTSEGRELFKFFEIKIVTVKDDTLAGPFIQKPFIGSFVEEKKHDDLNLWRMYGKENKEEARGCALTIKAKDFIEGIEKKLSSGEDKALKLSDDIKFYRVAYRRSDRPENFTIPGWSKGRERNLNNQMKILKTRVNDYYETAESKKELEEYVNSIAFLFKSDVYKSENEIRLVVKGIGFEKNIDTSPNRPRVYIELVNIRPMIEKITLGPKVEKPDEWAAAFYYSYDKTPARPEILISHLPFK